jgi:hypothetical protein
MLFDPQGHEQLTGEAWEPDRVGAAIREIARDAESSFGDGWPTHPVDVDDEGDDERRFRTVYLGGAGVVHALDSLQRRGLVDLRRDYVPYLERTYEPDFPRDDHPPSLWMGETGIRLVLQGIAPSSANADRLEQLIAANLDDERREVMWGSPGTMLAARALYDATGEARWLELWRQSADRLRRAWDDETNLWTQHLYGDTVRYLGPAHGFAGCVLALSAEPDDDLLRRVGDVVRREAVEEDGLANWPPDASVPLEHPRTGEIRTQWCHGAPGLVASLAGLAGDGELDRLLLAGGELTWHAGPLAKGANLCHGTAGNGYAFLALHARTGDELWLERARAFAMHATSQVAHARAALGRGRYSLWTGDPGTALYLADCLAGGGSLPLP